MRLQCSRRIAVAARLVRMARTPTSKTAAAPKAPGLRRTPSQDGPARAQSAGKRTLTTSQAATATQEAIPAEVGGLYEGAMPKAEIGALKLIERNARWDGRGTIVAIFDSGVDPAAAGLQVTSDGKPKVIDIIDCTGSGDVDTSQVVQADKDGVIEGASGRKMKVNPDWDNPSGEWRVGCRRLFDFMTSSLINRLKRERAKAFDEAQRAAVAAAGKALADFDRENPSPDTEGGKRREELEARVKLLTELAEKRKDLGPMVEFVVWKDGEGCWQGAVDTADLYAEGSGEGALGDFSPMTDFDVKRQWAVFSPTDSCTFGFHFYQDGDVLSVVTDCSPHGTHVAGITAAYHPEDPALNGVAPGAQIISCKIGDGRLGSMETGPGLTRAIAACIKHKCDLINMSYGEATRTPDAGRFVDLANEVVNKHGVLFVSSAGNAGPALTTVGAPGGTSSAIISVGAYVTTDLAQTGHSVRGDSPGDQQYTWSSRGPTSDGYPGVTLSAPGGAIAPVPQWTTQKRQLMNGTSMASPSACGGIALVLSALKDLDIARDPPRVRLALENTCRPLGDEEVGPWVLTSGRGLIQCDAAVEYLEKSSNIPFGDLRYDVHVTASGSSARTRGLYLRDPPTHASKLQATVSVTPALHDSSDVATERCNVEERLELVTTAPWVHAPSKLLLHHLGRVFNVEVDPTALAPGVHYAEIHAYDAAARWRGPLFRVPVTVTRGERPDPPPFIDLGEFAFEAGTEVRRFVEVPQGATWAEVRFESVESDVPLNYMLRATHLMPQQRYSDTEARSFVSLEPHSQHALHLPLSGGTTMEITMSQFWTALGRSKLRCSVDFHAITCPPQVHIDGAVGVRPVDLWAPLRPEAVSPDAKLATVRIPVTPHASRIVPSPDARDELPEGRTIHLMQLDYKLKLTEAGKVTPRIPMINAHVYDAVFEGQMYFLRDKNGRRVATGDLYPEPVDLKAGDYTLTLQLRDESVDVLSAWEDTTVVFERALAAPIEVPCYASMANAVNAKPAFKGRTLARGERARVFLGPVPADKLPKDATPGSVLAGTVAWGTKGSTKGGGGGGACADRRQLSMTVGPKKQPKKKDEAKKTDEEKSKEQEMIKKAIALLGKLDREEAGQKKLFDALVKGLAEGDDALAAASEVLKAKEADVADEAKRTPQAHRAVVEAAEAVRKCCDEAAMAAFAARKNSDDETEDEKKHAEKMAEQTKAYVTACEAEVRALLELHPDAPKKAAGADKDPEDPVRAAWKRLRAWADTSDAKYAVLNARVEKRAGNTAKAVKALEKVTGGGDEPPTKEALELRAELFEKLGWQHWARAERSQKLACFPPTPDLF
ncbi:unnamed protein product [Pedinophyceae sp. YPF-701]|nr:unnamed protein product [Pedinophyceae sp. YPF-701]